MSVTYREITRDELPEWAEFSASLSDHPIAMAENNSRDGGMHDHVLRWKEKPITVWLCDHIDLNEMNKAFQQGAFSREEFMQFYREIGYSLGGFEEIWGEVMDKMEEADND